MQVQHFSLIKILADFIYSRELLLKFQVDVAYNFFFSKCPDPEHRIQQKKLPFCPTMGSFLFLQLWIQYTAAKHEKYLCEANRVMNRTCQSLHIFSQCLWCYQWKVECKPNWYRKLHLWKVFVDILWDFKVNELHCKVGNVHIGVNPATSKRRKVWHQQGLLTLLMCECGKKI